MNLRPVSAAALAALFAISGVVAQDSKPAPKVGAADPAALVRLLDDPSYDVRAKATDDLRALGEKARAALEARRDAEALETRTRVRDLLNELDAAKAGRRPGPHGEGEVVRPDDGSARSEDAAREQLRRFFEPRGFDPFGPFPPIGPFRDMDAWRKSLEDMDKLHEEMERLMRDGVERRFDLGGGGTSFRFELGPGGSATSTRYVTTPDGLQAEVIESQDGVVLKLRENDVTTTYEAADMETLKAQYPEVAERLKNYGVLDSGSTRVFRGGVLAPRAESRASGAKARRLEPIDGGVAPTPPKIGPAPAPPSPPRSEGDVRGGRRVLGVSVVAPPPILDKHLRLGGVGVVVQTVEPSSEADRAGVRADDVLTHLDGEPVASVDDVRRLVGASKGALKIRLIREGAVVELETAAPKTR
jgi:hypothetical protein